jgi:hypothetical protein
MQISRLVVSHDKDPDVVGLVGVAKLKIGNPVGSNLVELEKRVKDHIENVQSRCSALVPNDAGGIVSNEDAEKLRGMMQALVNAEGAVWRGTLQAQDLA